MGGEVENIKRLEEKIVEVGPGQRAIPYYRFSDGSLVNMPLMSNFFIVTRKYCFLSRLVHKVCKVYKGRESFGSGLTTDWGTVDKIPLEIIIWGIL